MAEGFMNVRAIDPKDLLTYLCLRRYKNKTTGEASVPITTIVKQTGAAPVTVLNSLKRLEVFGHIQYTKRGRANVYKFVTDLDASSYDFLDQHLTHSAKVKLATQVVTDSKPKAKASSMEESKLVRYVVTLEKKIVTLSEHVRFITDELNKSRKSLSVITGQPYEPVPQLDL